MVRVVFYARVSTDSEEQLNSLKSQQEYFQKFINDHPDWEYCGMYVDEGITGTNTIKRKRFKDMIADATAGKFDLILTREVSRFARNTVDTLNYTRELKSNKVRVIFTLDNIDTFDREGEFRLTIMASIAQEEARKTSNNVKWKLNHLMSTGAVLGNSNIFGYTIKNKKLYIDEKQAEIVRLIFDLYLKGLGERKICTELMERKIPTASGKLKWQAAVIKGILKNPKYAGDLVQHLYVTPDFLTKKQIRNKNTSEYGEYIVIRDNHEPIVSREQWNKVQEELKRRNDYIKTNQRYSSRYVLSGKIKCSFCGRNYKRTIYNISRVDGARTYKWMCQEQANHGKAKKLDNGEIVGCDSSFIPELLLNEIILRAVEFISLNKESILTHTKNILAKSIVLNDNTKEIEMLNREIDKYTEKHKMLLGLYTDQIISRDEYLTEKKEYDTIINICTTKLNKHNQSSRNFLTLESKLNDLEFILSKVLDFKGNSLPDEIVENILNKMVIHSKNKVDIYLNSGIELKYDKENNTPFVVCDRCNTVKSIVGIGTWNIQVSERTATLCRVKNTWDVSNEIEINFYLVA